MIPPEPEQQSVRSAITDEMVEAAADAIAGEFGYVLRDDEEMYDTSYWKPLARRVLEAALGDV